LRPGRLRVDLERELRFHIEERIHELTAAGVPEPEASRMAHRQFGNFASQLEGTHDMNISQALDGAVRNVRYAFRSLRKAPAFAVTVILTLAIGMGANSTVFSAIHAVLLRPLPFPESDRIVRIGQVRPRVPGEFAAPVRLEEWNRLNTVFQSISGVYSDDVSELSGELPEKMKRAFVAPRFLATLGVSPAIGRTFTAEEERFGGPGAVIISDALWRRRFGADPAAVGKMLRIGRGSVPIVGIMPPTFHFPARDVDFWAPSPPDAPYAQNREATWLSAIGRMKPGVTVAQAQANLAAVQAGLAKEFPKPDADISVTVVALQESAVGGIRASLWLLYGAVTLLLLIACTNIAALLLSRAAGRAQEFAVRYSLGASRAAVAGQVLTEVLLLALAGSAAGLAIAWAASGVFRSMARNIPRVEDVGLNWTIVGYSLASAVVVALLCGLAPALRGTRQSLASSLAQGGRTSTGGRNPVQMVLAGVQVAFAVTLLAGAGLLARSLQELGRVSPGFDPNQVLVFHISSTWAETGTDVTRTVSDRILENLRTIPGVETAATALALPGVPLKVQVELTADEGRAETEPKLVTEGRMVSPSYFATMRIPLLAGETCREGVNVAELMVNRAFASKYFPGQQIIGRSLRQANVSNTTPRLVRGIVDDAREAGLDREAPPVAYLCSSHLQPGTHFLVRANGDLDALAGTVRRRVRELEPRRSLFGFAPLESLISDAFAANRLRTYLVSFFALTAICLASVGLYGTLSYLVAIRRREIAVRLALGAVRQRILGQYLTQGVRVALVGCVAGLAMALASNRLLRDMLYGIQAADGFVLGGVALVVMSIATLASLVPAWRASRLEPLEALREE